MKKIGILALVFVLAAALTGCDPIPGFSKDKDTDNTAADPPSARSMERP